MDDAGDIGGGETRGRRLLLVDVEPPLRTRTLHVPIRVDDPGRALEALRQALGVAAALETLGEEPQADAQEKSRRTFLAQAASMRSAGRTPSGSLARARTPA